MGGYTVFSEIAYYIRKIAANEPGRKANKTGAPKDEYFDFGLIGYYFRNKSHPDALQVISDRVSNDMDFEELFTFLDRTHSKVGQQYLYNQLLVIPSEPDFETQEELIRNFTADTARFSKTEALLSKLNNRNAYYLAHLFLDEYIPAPKRFWLLPVLSVAGLASFLLFLFIPEAFFCLLPVYTVNLIIHFWNKKNSLVYADSIPQLALFARVANGLAGMHAITGSKRAVPEAAASILKLKYFIKLFRFDTGIRSEIEAIILFFWELIKILLLIEPLTVFAVFKKLKDKKNDLRMLFDYIGKIDAATSVATLRKEAPYWCQPVIGEAPRRIGFTAAYHPLIPGCIANSLELNNKSILLTGSNMSGKTTFIRAAAINLLLAQTINTCFAEEFHCAPSRLFSAIRISDDLLSHKSYYLEEVLTLKEMVEESRARTNQVFFLDEIFKGTNTVERIAAGKAVLSYLARTGNNIVFVSTHDIELTDLLAGEFDLYHFTEVIHSNRIRFDYRLKAGNLATRNAIRILEINRYPAEITDDARQVVRRMQKPS